MKRISLACLLASVALSACGKKADPKPVADEGDIEPADPNDIDALASKMEELVTKNDIAGIEQLWLTPDELEGCVVEGKDVSKEKMMAFPEKNIEKFRTDAQNFMAEAKQGEILHTNRWARKKAEFMNGTLSGDGCKAESFGRINVIVKPKTAPPAVVEHRFNLELVGGQWRIFKYMPLEPDCETAKGKKHAGCKKLEELGG